MHNQPFHVSGKRPIIWSYDGLIHWHIDVTWSQWFQEAVDLYELTSDEDIDACEPYFDNIHVRLSLPNKL